MQLLFLDNNQIKTKHCEIGDDVQSYKSRDANTTREQGVTFIVYTLFVMY